MIILNTASSSQTFTFIPRSFAISGELEVIDEETGIVQTQNIAIQKLNNLGSTSATLSLEEGKFYSMKITSLGSNWDSTFATWNLVTINWDEALTPVGDTWATVVEAYNSITGNWDDVRSPVTTTIYRDRIFCTNQTISQRSQEYYNPIKGIYKTSSSGDNTYKVYNGPTT